ncbi:MAG: FAD-dependent oxidoreductase [Clostridiales bacterium]|nr:FAD-dependent oxidoreductase [Clostridiales bacterium]
MKKQTDVVVMGSGMAGICAADAALARGKKVIVFEKKPYQGGAAGNCPIAFLSIRKDKEYQDAAFKLLYEYSNYNANPAVIRAYVNNSWRTREYIERLHVKMMQVASVPLEEIGSPKYADGFPSAIQAHGDMYFALGRGKGHGAALICLNAMRDIEKRGGEYMLNTPITDILTDENGKVIGVTGINNETSERVDVACEAIIVASGGIMDDRKMMKEYTGFTYTDNSCRDGGNVLFNCFPNSGQTGDGQKLVWKLGGAKTSIRVTGHNLCPGPGIVASSPWIVYNQMRNIQEQPYLWINKNGERFVDETISNNHMAISTAIYNQPGRVSYILFDEDTKLHMEQEGVDYQYFIFPAEKLTNVTEQFRRLIEDKKMNMYLWRTLWKNSAYKPASTQMVSMIR